MKLKSSFRNDLSRRLATMSSAAGLVRLLGGDQSEQRNLASPFPRRELISFRPVSLLSARPAWARMLFRAAAKGAICSSGWTFY